MNCLTKSDTEPLLRNTMSNIAEIREQMFEKKDAQRIIIKVHTEKLDSQDYRFSAYKFVNGIFPNWENDKRILFLAIEI
jgi:hypothetical protein